MTKRTRAEEKVAAQGQAVQADPGKFLDLPKLLFQLIRRFLHQLTFCDPEEHGLREEDHVFPVPGGLEGEGLRKPGLVFGPRESGGEEEGSMPRRVQAWTRAEKRVSLKDRLCSWRPR